MDKLSLDQRLAMRRPLLMGVLNITPDSFHDGGLYMTRSAARSRLRQLLNQGADIVDMGGASSRPGHRPLPAEEEWRRIQPLLEGARDIPALVSVDTEQLAVAEAALAAGADMLNYTGGRLEREIFAAAARHKAYLVVMERQGEEGRRPQVVEEAESFFREAIALGESLGLERRHIILDPGPGFGKDVHESALVMSALPRFRTFGCPLLAAYSHKRFIAAQSGERPGNTPIGNRWAATEYTRLGADILRVHEVADTKQALGEAWGGC